MIDFSDILSRASSRLFVAFVVTIWACVTYTDLTWILITAFGIFTVGYIVVKTAGYHYAIEENGDYNYDRSDIVTSGGRFKDSEIGPLNKEDENA